ncbi:hypothetical protein E2C01_027850 [Portunus trituberculatus]|uniref:Uncharacterized protein n=1 Tax=Portunus trituberculatus TaxID=210409 RepID=A0A5B7EMA3_PORTR|nr:hypothetical protein [Portunus trituberculatus]
MVLGSATLKCLLPVISRVLVMDNIEEEGEERGGGRSSKDESPSMKTSGVIPVNPLVEGFSSQKLAFSLDSLF